MRPRLALAGVVAGAAAFLAPVAPASAYCAEDRVPVEGGGTGQCTNACYETGDAYEDLRTSLPVGQKLPSYWDVFSCLA